MRIAILIPAAGNSSRLGQPKQLVNFQGQPLLLKQINLCAQLAEVYCVLGAHAQAINDQISHSTSKANCRFVYNPNWQKGLAHSIAFGVKQLPEHIDAVMIVLGDQWALEQQDLAQLIQQWQKQPNHIHASLYEQAQKKPQTGVPAIFPARFFTQLTQLSDSTQGAKQILKHYQSEVVAVPLANAAADLDTPEQLNEIKNLVYGE